MEDELTGDLVQVVGAHLLTGLVTLVPGAGGVAEESTQVTTGKALPAGRLTSTERTEGKVLDSPDLRPHPVSVTGQLEALHQTVSLHQAGPH